LFASDLLPAFLFLNSGTKKLRAKEKMRSDGSKISLIPKLENESYETQKYWLTCRIHKDGCSCEGSTETIVVHPFYLKI
jgi:hypothetical protein